MIIWEDGTKFDPPVNPLKDKWAILYPPIPKPNNSQVCDEYSCMWCERCPKGSYWKCPEEDKEIYDKWQKEYCDYMESHGGFAKMYVCLDEIKDIIFGGLFNEQSKK